MASLPLVDLLRRRSIFLTIYCANFVKEGVYILCLINMYGMLAMGRIY